MKIYLVGGAVRDELLNLTVGERDWVVVGARAEELTAQGFRAVGKDFPVFLHPDTHEEYALARTERKTAAGYHGFDTRFTPDVTLEQDLERRDLTINAIAKDPDTGALIDPYGGQRDIADRILRHVSPAFVEDPVRVLRIARFAARFAPLGFRVAPETLQLIKAIAASGELDALVPERVWQETQRALTMQQPQAFFATLRDGDALRPVFPEIDALFGVPQPAQWHPEIDTGVHTLMVLEQAAQLSSDPIVRFAALTHDVGKAATAQEHWPRHVGHEHLGVTILDKLCARLRVPTDYRDVARSVARYHGLAHRVAELRESTLLELMENLDAVRRPARFEQFVLACEADARGRTGFEKRDYAQSDYLRRAQQLIASVKLDREQLDKLNGQQIAEALRRQRLDALREFKASYVWNAK